MIAVGYGAQSMTAPLREALVKRPGAAFARAHEDAAHGFLHPVDLAAAQREHDRLCELLAGLGVTVHELGAEDGPDLVYTFDPVLVSDAGTITLRSGKPTRRAEGPIVERWLAERGVPVAGRLEAPGTADGGDTCWLRPDLFLIGRTLRTSSAGIAQLAGIVGGDVRVFDLGYGAGPSACLHLLSVLSPVADDLAVVYRPLLPVGVFELLGDLGYRLVDVPDDEYATLGANVLAVAPGVVVVAAGNDAVARQLARQGCEVHAFPAGEVGLNGSGGPTCLVRPILRR